MKDSRVFGQFFINVKYQFSYDVSFFSRHFQVLKKRTKEQLDHKNQMNA